MFTLLAALLMSPMAEAQAPPTSRLVISSDAPFVGFRLDGRFLEYGNDGRIVTDVTGGRHEVVIGKGIAFKEIDRVFVDIPQGHEVRCRWQKAASLFDCYESVALAPAPMAVQPATGVVATGSTTTTTTTTTTGTAPGMGVGITVSGQGGAGGGSVSIGVGGVGVAGTASTTTTHSTTTTTTGVAPVAAGAPVGVPAKVKLVVRSLDESWADVVVDGKVELELRNESEGFIWVSPGMHTIEFREFMEDTPYARGRLDTGTAAQVTFGIREGAPAEVYDHNGWRAR